MCEKKFEREYKLTGEECNSAQEEEQFGEYEGARKGAEFMKNEKNMYLHQDFRKIGGLMRRMRAEHGRGNFPSTQNRALTILAMNDGISQSELAYVLGIRPQSSGEIAVKLERNGWVEKKNDSEDSRVNRLYLTEAGKNQVKILQDAKERGDIFDCLSEEEKDTLSALLNKIIVSNPDIKDEEERPHPRHHGPRRIHMGPQKDDEVRMMPADRFKGRMDARRVPFEIDNREEEYQPSRGFKNGCERMHCRPGRKDFEKKS